MSVADQFLFSLRRPSDPDELRLQAPDQVRPMTSQQRSFLHTE